MTAVVAVMHIFCETKLNSPDAKAKTSAKKAKLGPKSKKISQNWHETHLEEVKQPPNNASKRLLVKKKTIRVLLDTGLSGDFFFIEKKI